MKSGDFRFAELGMSDSDLSGIAVRRQGEINVNIFRLD